LGKCSLLPHHWCTPKHAKRRGLTRQSS
jgi:hypothetical protein